MEHKFSVFFKYLILLCVFLTSILLFYQYCPEKKVGASPVVRKPGKVVIRAENPYSLRVRMEIKCDWDGKIRRYKYWDLIEIPNKGSVLVIVPNGLSYCEIWPKIIWFN